MKIITASSGKKTLKLSKSEWLSIGKKANWDGETKYDYKTQRAVLVNRLREWQRIAQKEVDPDAIEIAKNTLVEISKMIKKLDEYEKTRNPSSEKTVSREAEVKPGSGEVNKNANSVKGDKTVHPLDRKCNSSFGVIPEENYYRSVWAKLVDITASDRNVSEKAFKDREAIHKEVDALLRRDNIMKVVSACERSNKRAELCAELIFDKTPVFSKKAQATGSLDPNTFYYYINLDERGSFYADVRNSNDETVFQIKDGDALPEGESSIFEDGYMKHKYDFDGLRSYLIQLGIMKQGQKLVSGN